MNKIAIVAETGSDITQAMAEKLGIYLVPMYVTLGQQTKRDGTFPVEEVCQFYENEGDLPKTSGASPADFEKIFDEIHQKYPHKHILHLAYSAQTTCSYQSAIIAGMDRDYVTSIDTKQVSVGQFAIVTTLAKYINKHPKTDHLEAIRIVEELCMNTKMCFLPDNLEYLRAGGRVGNVAFMGSRILSLHPSIEIIDGQLLAKKKYRGRMTKVAIEMLLDFSKKHNFDRQNLWLIWSIGLENQVKEHVEKTAKELGYKKIYWVQTGCVITTHGGPKCFGVVGMKEITCINKT